MVFLAKKALYRIGLFKAYRAPVPLIVVGNITVGGTGKTPMVIYLVEQLRLLGYQPGVISRGYGGKSEHYPVVVESDAPASVAGDEPALIVRRCQVPMVVGPNRREDIERLLDSFEVDIIISDDGLQHFAMQRDIEICLLDQTRDDKNTSLLPAGPYREPHSRLSSVDIVVAHRVEQGAGDDVVMSLEAGQPLPVSTSLQTEFDASDGVHAVAGIGNPQRFFRTCRGQGWTIEEHVFDDHHQYVASDLDFGDGKPVIMTEKDAVKCKNFATNLHWYLPVDVKMSTSFIRSLKPLLSRITNPDSEK